MITSTIILMMVSISLILDVLDKTNLVRVLTLVVSISASCLKVLQEVLSGRLPLTTSTLVVRRKAHTLGWTLKQISTLGTLLKA